MSRIVWSLAVPATVLMQGPFFAQLSRRLCELSFDVEDEQGGAKRVSLFFDGVEAYKCTYLTSLTKEMINAAYGRVVNLDKTNWLSEVSGAYSNRRGALPKKLLHLMICFDDGPCYEFICESFRQD